MMTRVTLKGYSDDHSYFICTCGRKVYLTYSGMTRIMNDKLIQCPFCLEWKRVSHK
jgi:DNA-directed RNA polymerase subunit RPC12/RpoP